MQRAPFTNNWIIEWNIEDLNIKTFGLLQSQGWVAHCCQILRLRTSEHLLLVTMLARGNLAQMAVTVILEWFFVCWACVEAGKNEGPDRCNHLPVCFDCAQEQAVSASRM